MKEQEIQATEEEKKKIFENIKMEELDEINIDSQNDAFLENYLNNKYKIKLENLNNEQNYSVIASNQIQINSVNKKENKFKNLNITKNLENEIKGENENKLRAKKKEKETPIEMKPNLIEQFNLKGVKTTEKRMFTNLDIKKCEGQEIKGIKKEQKNLEKKSNGELLIKKEKKQKKEIETQVELDLINNNLILEHDIKYKINNQKKEENIIVKNKSFNIRHKNKQNSDLIIVKQKKLNLLQKSSKKFSKETIEPCYSESLTIKTRESYEEPLPNYRLSKKFTKFLISDDENSMPKNDINLISTLTETNENQFAIIGDKSEVIKENEENDQIGEKEEYIQKPIYDQEIINPDFDKNMTKQFINNMVQNKLEIEKKKNMDNTKNKLIIVFKAMKMKNALNKNTKNKKYFLNALKQIKEIKKTKLKSIIKTNTFSHNYLPKDKNKQKEYKDSSNLKQNIPSSKLYIENNSIEIKYKKKKAIKRLLSEIKENIINIEGINKNRKDIEKKFSDVKNMLSESFFFESATKLKRKNYIDTQTQTPKLRPKNKQTYKVILNEIKTTEKNEKPFPNYKTNNKYEINHILDLNYSGKTNSNNYSNNSLKIEKEDIKDPNKLFRISKFNNFFRYFFDSNKKIYFLKLLCLIKWNHLRKDFDLDKSRSRKKHKDIKELFDKSKTIFINKLLDFSKKYKTEKAFNLMTNLFNRRKKGVVNILKKNKKGKKLDSTLLKKNNIAFLKLKSIFRKFCGKYVFSLYKKNK